MEVDVARRAVVAAARLAGDAARSGRVALLRRAPARLPRPERRHQSVRRRPGGARDGVVGATEHHAAALRRPRRPSRPVAAAERSEIHRSAPAGQPTRLHSENRASTGRRGTDAVCTRCDIQRRGVVKIS